MCIDHRGGKCECWCFGCIPPDPLHHDAEYDEAVRKGIADSTPSNQIVLSPELPKFSLDEEILISSSRDAVPVEELARFLNAWCPEKMVLSAEMLSESLPLTEEWVRVGNLMEMIRLRISTG